MIYLILTLYLVFTFWGSLVGFRPNNNTPESYFLANRGLKTLALFFTILATNFSAFFFLGFAGEAYRIGYAHYTIMALGTGLAGLSIYLVGSKAWKWGKERGYITPAELIYDRTGSRALSYLFAGVMVVFTMPYLALQIIGGGYILENLTNGEIPYLFGVFLLTVFTIAYVLLGGMASVAKTDLKQGMLMILFMLLAVVVVSVQLGGIATANELVYNLDPTLFSIEGKDGYYTPQKWFSLLFFWFFCIPMFPQLFIRFYVASDLVHLKKTVIFYALIPVVISILPVIIGVWGHLSFPGLEGKAADQILPMMLLEHSTDWFAALVMTGALAAFMSTLDSQLLALSTILTRDFYLPITKAKISFPQEVAIGRIFVGLLALIGLILAINPFDTIFDMGKIAFAGLAILFPVTIAVTRFGGINPSYGIGSIIVGLFALLGFYYQFLPAAWLMGFEAYVIIMVICFLIVFVGVWRKPAQEIENKRI